MPDPCAATPRLTSSSRPRARSFADTLRADDWAQLRRAGLRALHPQGSTLLDEGAHPPGLLLLISGRVELMLMRGGRRIPLELLDAGALVPDLGPLHGRPAGVSAVALDRVDVLYVPPLAFAAFLEARPAAALAALGAQSAALSRAYRRSAANASGDTLTRLARGLLELADDFGRRGDGLVIDVGVTQAELAGWIAASPKATATALAQLRRLGVVQTARRRVTVRDPEQLARIAAPACEPPIDQQPSRGRENP